MAEDTFIVVATLEDPLAAQRLVEELDREGVEAFTRPGGAASSAAFAQAQPAFWDLLVPSASAERSRELVVRFQAVLEAEAALNERAAEEEATPATAGDPATTGGDPPTGNGPGAAG